MEEITEQIKDLPIINALGYMASGLKKNAACDKAGISVSTFDRAIAQNKNLVIEFVNITRGKLQETYSEIVTARALVRQKALDKLTEEYLNNLSVDELLMLDGTLGKLQGSVEQQLSFVGGPETGSEPAKKVLDVDTSVIPAPTLRPAVQRVIQRDVTTEIIFNQSSDTPSRLEPIVIHQEPFIEGEIKDQ